MKYLCSKSQQSQKSVRLGKDIGGRALGNTLGHNPVPCVSLLLMRGSIRVNLPPRSFHLLPSEPLEHRSDQFVGVITHSVEGIHTRAHPTGSEVRIEIETRPLFLVPASPCHLPYSLESKNTVKKKKMSISQSSACGFGGTLAFCIEAHCLWSLGVLRGHERHPPESMAGERLER